MRHGIEIRPHLQGLLFLPNVYSSPIQEINEKIFGYLCILPLAMAMRPALFPP